MKKKNLLQEVEFEIKPGQSLIINYYSLLGAGLDRVVVKNKNGSVKVEASGGNGSKFEFEDRSAKKKNKHECDFWLANPQENVLIEYIIRSKFRKQFTLIQLSQILKDKKLKAKIDRKIKKLVQEFEEKASQELNQLVKN